MEEYSQVWVVPLWIFFFFFFVVAMFIIAEILILFISFTITRVTCTRYGHRQISRVDERIKKVIRIFGNRKSP